MAYPGGKGRIHQKIISLIPPHRVYVEAFLGGGAVMLAKRPAHFSVGIDLDPRVVAAWRARRIDGLSLVQCDAIDWLSRYEFVGEEFLYCDPPYPAQTRRSRRVYRYEPSPDEHAALLHVLLSLPCKVMVSSYPNAAYERVLRDWSRVILSSPSQTGLRTECLWMNYEPPTVLHDHSHIGDTFREREAIRRRRTTIIDRFNRLSALERSAVLVEMADADPRAFGALVARFEMDTQRADTPTSFEGVEA